MGTIALLRFCSWATVAELLTTFSFIFGGCCSNALTLEVITSQYPPAGTLITFAQFLFVALVGLRKQLILLPMRVARQDALRRVANMSFDAQAKAISIYCPDDRLSRAFAQDLAPLVEGTLAHFGHEVQPGNGNGDPFVRMKKEPLQIICDPTEQSNPSNSFKVLLQMDPVVSNKMDTVLDVSVPDQPSLLYPRAARISLNPFQYRLKHRHIPLSRYAVQVLLFLLISLLNNAAFAYRVPMAVHIIFRSGGLVVNMLMGWAFEKRRYSRVQVASVFLVTFGVALTTLSATQSKSHASPKAEVSAHAYSNLEIESTSYRQYAIGIAILTLALVLSGALGLSQDRTFERYGRGHWEEAMFYLHALALPLFGFTWRDLVSQVRTANAGRQLALPFSSASDSDAHHLSPLPYLPIRPPSLRIPAFYVPLFLNVLTQLFCVAGVNRLTSHMNSLTVSLVLVVRKATSLAVSVLLLGGSRGNVYLWSGAAAVLVGTIGYTLASQSAPKKKRE
ncbi:UAA-domain-containing protein [Fomitiporia mediterranea MF3/22]|uniref:UAA-domain-containing protein n=1 Tax=Fomitiporia mediterranea (strain MF3/22) TaxID=694068 RepID=UPI0004408DE6|nr:UAA-domain-containing protein [Fomitiporia mediterranea MF3/22]EJD00879.1 UAA-domain-containing protein [Fomitiporia mediterranea MF3/22]